MELTFDKLPEAVSKLFNKLENIERLLIKNGDELNKDVDQLLTIQQASEMLNLSVPTLYGKVHFAEIPVCKKGKRLYFSKKELTEWVKSGRKKTVGEIAAEAHTYLKKKGGNK